MDFRKTITEQEMLACLTTGEFQFPPLKIADVRVQPNLNAEGENVQIDALLTLEWRERAFQFVVETKRLWTPKSVATAADMARKYSREVGLRPLIFVPYLSPEQILKLESQAISGIDLCGNGIVTVPNELLVMRAGAPNQFRWESAIKNVYRKNSSIVARVFLLVSAFESVNQVLKEIKHRGGEITVATVSKVCTTLESDLILERGGGDTPTARRLRLIQPEKLLDQLAEQYAPPAVKRTFQGKCALTPQELRARFTQWEMKSERKVIQTGVGSVNSYAVMVREPVQSYYCTDLKSLLHTLGGDITETDRFSNVAFQETKDDFVYFDRRPDFVASPIQTYLELNKGDNREKQTAENVRRLILDQMTQTS